MTGRSKAARLLTATLLLCTCGMMWDGAHHVALAQNPFGAPAPDFATGGPIGWVLAKQAGFYRELSAAIRAAKSDGSAAWKLLAISFAYGLFHAAGPGHGKAVIASYLVANNETARRGIVLSFLSAILQAFVAVAIVGVGAWLLNATARSLCGTERIVEIANYLIIAAVGGWMLWTKAASFFRLFRSGPLKVQAGPSAFQCVDSSVGHAAHHSCRHAVHRDDHRHGADCSHAHGQMPQDLAGRGGWRRGLAATAAAGMRPCSGAILVLIFASAQNLFWLGIAATFAMGFGTALTVATVAFITLTARDLARRLIGTQIARSMLWIRAFEVAAAALVLLLGAGLLLGYVASERVTCF